MSAKDYKGLQEAYNSIYEALTDQAELDNLRKASAQATMAGPSKEAQALMSDRAKRMLGADKLKAGIAGQERVQRMMKGIPEPKPATTTAAPAPTGTTGSTASAPPKPTSTVKPGDYGTTMGAGPSLSGPISPKLPSKTVIQPTDWGSMKSPVSSQMPSTPQAPKAPVPDRSADYQRAWDNRNNPLAKGKIRSTWSQMGPEEKAAAKEWAKANNKNWQEMGLPEQRDIYDEVLEILLDEGYSEQECNQIMVQLVNEGIWDAVKQRTGIGKPGVGPGQVFKNVVKAGITDILGTSIATGSTPSSVSAAKPSPAATTSPAPQVRVSTQTIRKAPKGANKITTNVWNEPSAPSSRINPSKPSGPRITSTRALPGTNVRGLLPQGVRNVLPDPWKDATNAVSGTRNLWNRVQQAVKPQAQLKPSQTNVRGLLPAAKPSPQNVAKPATSVRSQQFQDVQRLNKMMKGGLIGELPSTKPESKPAPKPSGNVDKIAPKPTRTAKPSVKPKMPSGGSNLLQGLGALASLRKLTPYGIAAAVMEPRPTADGTLDAAKKRGDLNKGATNWVDPMPTPEILKRSGVSPKQEVKPVQTGEKPKSTVSPVVKKPAPAKPVDPDVQQYEKLKKSDPVKAKELGMKIWNRKYRSALTPPDIA